MPKSDLVTRKAKMPSQRLAGSFRPSTVNEEERTIEIIFTTGQGGKRYDWWNDVEYMEELDVTPESVRTERLDKGLSVIDNHNSHEGIDGVFGVTEDYRFEGGQLIGTARFASDEKSMERFRKAADGILRHVSLGYKVHKYLKSRGETDKLDTYRATDWEPTELSFVPVSFETTNGVRAEQRNNEPTYEVEILEERTMPKEKEAQDKERSAPNVVAAPAVEAAPTVDVDAVRSETIGTLQPMLDSVRAAGLKDDFAINLFNTGRSLDQAREAIITELGNKSSEAIIRNQGADLLSDEREDVKLQTRQDAENAILYRCGKNIELTEGVRNHNGLTLLDMARNYVEKSGVNTLGMSRTKLASRAFHSTSDFPLILENVMNKNLQAGYTQTPQTFRDLGRRTTVNDFRAKNMYNLGDAPSLLPLGEHGEYQSGTIGEGKEKYSIATFARSIGFTRQMLINDDMSALDAVPAKFGQAGANLESNIVWGLILNWDFFKNKAASHLMADGKPLFHADHNNLLLGAAASALDKTGLSNLRKMGRKMKTMDDNYMNIMWQNLVIPEELETAAEDILINNILANEVSKANQFRGKLDYRVEPRLAAVTGGDKAWYAFSNMADTFEYAYLAGEEEMMVEVVTETNVDGLKINVRKDFGAGMADYRGVAKAKGAA